MLYRIISNGHSFRVQYRSWYNPFWKTVERPEDLDNKDFGGPKDFDSKEKAEKYIESKKPEKWTVVG